MARGGKGRSEGLYDLAYCRTLLLHLSDPECPRPTNDSAFASAPDVFC
jgi:hypothetical protein